MILRTSRLVSFALFTSIAAGLVVFAGCGGMEEIETVAVGRDGYLFCFWNVENFFDDREDHRSNSADKEYDGWFANHPEILKQKLAHLSEAMISLNGGRGPDILAVAEVEGIRAAELLRDALNQRLADPALHYRHVLMKEVTAGRHIAPAIITRLPVQADRTQLLGRQERILEGHVVVNGQDLVILATHWTSRLTDADGHRREDYADKIYGRFRAMYESNPQVDFLICGDFNDPPDAPSVVNHLHATGDREAVGRSGRSGRSNGQPLLLDLFAGRNPDAGFGTHYYNGKWMLFDHIVVSPGLLDGQGWSCDADSAQTVNSLVKAGDKKHRPWRFGSAHDKSERGYSDHFPVTAKLKVQAP